MKHIKLFEDFKQLNIPFSEYNVDFDIDKFKEYLNMLNFEVKSQQNEIIRTSEGMTSQAFYNILPDEKYKLSFYFRIKFEDNEWDDYVRKLIEDYLKDEYDSKYKFSVRSVYQNYVEFYIIAKNEVQLYLEDWLKFFIEKGSYKLENGKLYGFVDGDKLMDILRISNSLATYFTNGDIDIDSIYSYESQDLEEALDYLDDENIELLKSKLSTEKDIDIEDYEEDELVQEIINTFTQMCYDISNEECLDDIYSRIIFKLKDCEFEIIDRFFEDGLFYYKFIFEKSWMEDLIKSNSNFSVNCDLFSIYKEYFDNFYNRVDIDTDYLISFTSYLDKEETKQYNEEIKYLITHY